MPGDIPGRFGAIKNIEAESAISRVLSRTIIYLGRQLPDASSDQPGKSASNFILPLLGLAAGGVYQESQSPGP